MNSIISPLNSALTRLFDLLLSPFAALDPLWGLLVFSLLCGILLVYIYGKVSNQKAIKNIKRRITGNLLESVLFRHDVRTALSAQAKMFFNGFAYFTRAIPPIIILAVPTILILAQLNLRYESRGFNPGERGVLKVKLNPGSDLSRVDLSTSSGLEATPAVRIQADNEIFWRIDTKEPGVQGLTLRSASGELALPVSAGAAFQIVTAHAFKNWVWNLLYPSPFLSAEKSADFAEISLEYPSRSYHIFGLELHWIVIFLIVSILAGIVGSKFLGVEI